MIINKGKETIEWKKVEFVCDACDSIVHHEKWPHELGHT